MKVLSKELLFPKVEEANPDGLLAIGGDLSTERLLLAYRSGIFPWYEANQPILWWSPNPRMVLFLEDVTISKSLKKVIRKQEFTVTFNKNFDAVIEQCACVKRAGQQGTWITKEMICAYQKLHKLGHALSFEVWRDIVLVGGGYGIDLPEQKVFCGESMFSLESNASKVGFESLINRCAGENYQIIDCQVYTSHLERFGAKEISRSSFMELLTQSHSAY
ncbi:leucyl/phenylalanyl-tRNA--protein transferase [Rasiella rasia]|uniref:Leucyl/phenylalanyl-tRNA--protein transferase n=1 Tax=Rasiella rasia TaxID=2744027 RepID=A0A6G6GM88_9FLAO|nr:leucyl/phenylalanyl-tRNA--protein transferase [Rasiella rasia]QIE59523.1 leucyl/phenylalanyl-tRNA--protein transferase [Rasiella rasia]